MLIKVITVLVVVLVVFFGFMCFCLVHGSEKPDWEREFEDKCQIDACNIYNNKKAAKKVSRKSI